MESYDIVLILSVLSQDKRSTAEESLYAMIAATEALEDCGWKPATEEDKQRTVSRRIVSLAAAPRRTQQKGCCDGD